MDFSPTIWEGIYKAAKTMPVKSYGRRYRKSRKVSRKLTPFKRYNSKALVTRAKTKTLTKLIKAVTLKQSETCYKTSSHVGYTVNHNVLTEINLWNADVPSSTVLMFPQQGNGDGERKGDEIITQGFRFRGLFQIPPDRRNTVIKMWFLPYNTAQGSPTTYANFFHNVVGSVMCDPIQSDRWRGIRYLGSYRVRARDLVNGEDSATIIINKWVPMRKKLRFINDGVTAVSNLTEKGSLIITAYDAIGTLQTDTLVNNSQVGITLYYKDP